MMKFTISKNELSEILQIVSKGMSARSTLPILSGFYIKATDGEVIFQSTDLEVSVKHIASALVESEGETVVPGKYFSEIVKSLPDAAVCCEVEDTLFKITCMDSEFKLNTLNPTDFPAFPEMQVDTSATISLGALSTMVKQVSKAVSRDETRAVLTGIFFMIEEDTLRMVATDSYRLAISEQKMEAPISEKFEVIVPGQIFDEVIRLASGFKDIKIGYTQNQVVFIFGTSTIITRKIEGNYPNYQQIIPKEKVVSMVVDTQGLVSAIKRASILVQDNSPLTFSIDSDAQLLTISSFSQEIGAVEDKIPVQITGESLQIGFNYKYILDGLQTVHAEQIVFEAQAPLKPGIFKTTDDEHFFYLTMPVRLSR